MSLTIKAFLHEKWGQDPVEIRRFTVDQDVTTSYAYLTQKIAAVFPALRAEHIVVAWTDDEGDLIVISSDEELVEALDQFDGSVFHLHLKKRTTAFTGPPREQQPTLESDHEEEEEGGERPKGEQSGGGEGAATTGDQGTFHPGVICDGCSGPVYGTRYKCLVCADYDLCASCESKGAHVDHNMVSIADPYSYHPWGGSHPRGRRGCGGWRGGRGWGKCGGRGRHPWGGGHHGWHGENYGGCNPSGGGQFGGGPFAGGPFGGGFGGGFSFPPFAHPYFRGRGGCGRFNRGGCKGAGKEGKAAEPMDTEQKPTTENEQEAQAQQQREFIQGIGQAVSSFLEPFGVKVDVGVTGNAEAKADATASAEGVPSGSNADTTSPPKEHEYNLDSGTAPPPPTDQWEFVPEGQPQASAPDHAYRDVLTQLQGMGFDDEGGWLSELVKAKGGDIGKVLDALNPSQEN